MELLALVFIWPFLLLLVGMVFLSAWDISGFLIMPFFLVFLYFVFGMRARFSGSKPGIDEAKDLEGMRRGLTAFSIALLLPIFVKYLLAVSGNSLPAMILGLIFGFGVIVWGMFMKRNSVIAYANSVGGGLAIIYLYIQLWSLGELAQVVATAFGLVVAIIVSIVKFRDKLS